MGGITVRRIDIDDPDVDMDLGMRLLYRGELFSGEVEEYLGGALISLDTYVDGVPEGPSREWYPDGTPRSESTARRGRAVGVARTWHRNGGLACERVFSEEGHLLSDRQWDERGRPTRAWQAESPAPDTP
jgi:antitoxin component YwqK of YwqJK toxin-antitoxin module